MIAQRSIRLSLLIILPLLVWLTGSYFGGLLTQFAALGLATAALAMCWGFAGILSLGHAVSFAIGAYSYAWFAINTDGFGPILGIVVGAVISGALSALIGYIGLRGKVDQVSFSLFTLVILFAAGQVAIAASQLTGGFNGLTGFSGLTIGGVALSPEVSRVVTALIVMGLVLVIRAVMAGPLGGMLVLLRENPLRAASLGYRVPKVRIAVFTAAGAIAAIAGSLYAAQVRFASPSLLEMGMAIGFVIWALIGSRTSILGVFTAAIVMGFITNLLSDKLLNLWMLITGLLFIGFVLFAPEGMVELVRRRLPARWRKTQPVVLQPFQQLGSSTALAVASAPSVDIRVNDVSVSFKKFRAVSNASLNVERGTIHVLIGPNGAGKSTLLNALSGVTPGASGTWMLGETDLSRVPPWRIARAGMGRKFQKPSIALDLTVAQNIALGTWGPTRSEWALVFASWNAEVAPDALRLMEKTGLMQLQDTPAEELSHGQRQILELCMLLASAPNALLLDEPAAGMTREESSFLGEVLVEIKETIGSPILMVEHDMELVHRIADRVTVLAAGKVIASGSVDVIENDPHVRDVYLGRHEDGAGTIGMADAGGSSEIGKS